MKNALIIEVRLGPSLPPKLHGLETIRVLVSSYTFDDFCVRLQYKFLSVDVIVCFKRLHFNIHP